MASTDDSGPNFHSDINNVFGLGVVISAMLYGGVATLTLTHIPLLLKTSHTISRRMRNFLLAFVTFMMTVSTINTFTLIIAFTTGLFLNSDALIWHTDHLVVTAILPNGFSGILCITFASWGANGFILWWCAVVYEGISRPRRLATLTVLILMAVISLGFGIYTLVSPYPGQILNQIIMVTTIFNVVTAVFIAARVLYFQKYKKTVGSDRNNQYTPVIAICVEFAALTIVLFSILCLVLRYLETPVATIFWQSFVHINVLSSLLIVYRVVIGKSLPYSAGRPDSEDDLAVLTSHLSSTRNTSSVSSVPEYELQDRRSISSISKVAF